MIDPESRQTVDRDAFSRPLRWRIRRILGLGIAIAVSVVLIWSVRDHLSKPHSPAAFRFQETAGGAPAPDTEGAHSVPALSASAQTPSIPDRPTGIAQIVARLLSGTPDLDPQYLRSMIDRARDPNQSLEDRVSAIRWLARLGDDEAFDVLERLLRNDSPPPIRALVAMALGESSHLSAARLLDSLLYDEDLDIVLGAIRGLANHRDPGTTETLKSLVANASVSDEIRFEAAEALSKRDGAAEPRRDTLSRSDDERAGDELERLVRQPLHEGEQGLRQWMEDLELTVDEKVAAVEALAEGDDETAEFLLEIARSSDDIELRSAAIDVLALFDEPGDTIAGLGALIHREPSSALRADLYNTLAFHADQADGPGSLELVRSALSESMPRAQLEGYRMVASMLNHQYDPGIAQSFDLQMVDWLQGSAEQGVDRYTRHLAIDALKLAGTPGAHEALLDLSHSTDASVSQRAEKALRLIAETGGSRMP